MKRCISAAFIAAAIVVMGFDNESKYIENGRIVLDSPFDLKLGSTEYAKTFGRLIRTSAHADYDPGTKKTTTNFYHHATAYLSTPYFGCDRVTLTFEGDDKVLSWCSFSIGKTTSDNTNIMSYTECRAVLDKIVDDMCKRCGITMQCTGSKTERQAKESVRVKLEDYTRRKEKFLGFDMSFVSFRAQKGSVVYQAHGSINEKERCYISVGCCDFQATSSSSSSYQPGDKIPVHTNETYSAIGRQVPAFRVEKGYFVIDSPAPQAEATTETEKARSQVEVVKDELHKLSAYVTNGCGADQKYFSELRSLVVELAAPERAEAFRVAKEVIDSSKLKGYPLSRRWASLDAYVRIIRRVAMLFHDQVEDQEGVWDFLLQSLDILDREYRTVASVSFDPRNPPMGLIMTTDQYLLRLDTERFYAVRWGFEGETFGGYYWRLPEEARKRWKEKIEKVARRKVGFRNPYNPSKSEPQPRRQFNPPPYLPEELREKYRSERRKVLKASGIDPKEEGL